MRIAGIAARFPSRVVSNEDILEMIAAASKDSLRGDFSASKALQRVRHMLRYSGSKYRRWSRPGEMRCRRWGNLRTALMAAQRNYGRSVLGW